MWIIISKQIATCQCQAKLCLKWECYTSISDVHVLSKLINLGEKCVPSSSVVRTKTSTLVTGASIHTIGTASTITIIVIRLPFAMHLKK